MPIWNDHFYILATDIPTIKMMMKAKKKKWKKFKWISTTSSIHDLEIECNQTPDLCGKSEVYRKKEKKNHDGCDMKQ